MLRTLKVVNMNEFSRKWQMDVLFTNANVEKRLFADGNDILLNLSNSKRDIKWKIMFISVWNGRIETRD